MAVPSQEPPMPMDNNMPPMDMPSDMPPAGNMEGMPPMDNGMSAPPMDEPNPYEADFDAGVEADEQTDPKRFIQQLTGKLAQSLRSYNSGLPQPDADLSKYVAGMVVKQAMEGLSQEDTTEILNKVSGKDDDNNGSETETVPTEGQFGESLDRIGNLEGGEKESPRGHIEGKKGYKREPFTPKRFS